MNRRVWVALLLNIDGKYGLGRGMILHCVINSLASHAFYNTLDISSC